MKSTVIKLISLLFILGFVVSCNSQDGQFGNGERGRGNGGQGNFDPETMAKRQVDRIAESLDLSEDQQEQAIELFKKIGERQAELRRESNGERGKMREMMAEINKTRDEDLRTILSEEQWVKWEELREEFQGQRRRRRSDN